MSEQQPSIPTGDRRTVSTDALETLGTIIDERQKRDAIHLAVIPVQAAMLLRAGDHVNLSASTKRAILCAPYTGLGIVDPFLREGTVRPEQWFWLVIYPRVITSLRHVWTHPALPDELGVPAPAPASGEDAVATARAALERWCNERGEITYDDLIEVSRCGRVSQQAGRCGWELDSGYLTCRGSDASGEIPPHIWDLVRIVIGQEPVDRADYFSCSC